MVGSTLALMTRSLREETRLLRTHLVRLLFAGIIVWLLGKAHLASATAGAPGLDFFHDITWLNFVLITLAAPGYFATMITEEKEEQTLGLLRMAGVGPLSLLLGKSATRLVGAALLLSAQFPFTLLAITLGGVTRGQIVAAYWCLLAWLLLTGGLGLFCSAVCRRSSGAARMTVLALGAFLMLPWLVWLAAQPFVGVSGFWATVIREADRVGQVLIAASPTSRIVEIMSTGFAEPPLGFQAVTNLSAAGAFFVLSWGLFGRFNRSEADSTPARGAAVRRRGLAGLFSAGRPWGRGLVWKDFHFLAGGRPMMVAKFVLYGLLWLGISLTFQLLLGGWIDWEREYAGATMMLVMLVTLMIETALHASRVFREESRWQTLPGLMMLPCSTAAVAYAKVGGCLIALLPAAAWFTVGAALYPEGFAEALEETFTTLGGWWAVSQYLLFLHLAAWLSLMVKFGALPLGLAIVIAWNGCCFTPLALSPSVSTGPDEEGVVFLIILFSLCAAAALHGLIGVRLERLASR